MESGRKFDIPCNLMDIRNMERFLEQKAREGYLLECYRWAFWGSVFEEVAEEEYCFHIDLYHKRLTKKDLETEEFLNYAAGFEQCGWTLRCVHENLVFFCSRGGRRPELPVNSQGDQAELLRDVTLKAARKQLAARIGWKAALMVCMEAILLWKTSNANVLMEPGLLIPAAWLLSTFLLDFVRHVTIAHRVKRLKAPLERRAFWDEWSMGLIVFILVAAGSVICFWNNRSAVFLALSAAVMLSSGFFVGYWIWKCKKGARPWKTSWVEIVGYVIPCGILIVLCTRMPLPGNFRYQLENGKSHYEAIIPGNEPAPEITGLGLNQSALGWGEPNVTFSHENPNRLCRWEWIVYSQDSLQSFFSKKHRSYARDSRYIGTMIAKLKDSGTIEAFLRQKKLTLPENGRLELLPGIQSYVCDGGKELVHVKDDLVIIHFLNPYDPRSFDVSDQRIREAVRGNLKMIFGEEKIMDTLDSFSSFG